MYIQESQDSKMRKDLVNARNMDSAGPSPANEDNLNVAQDTKQTQGPLQTIGIESDSSSSVARGDITPLNESEEDCMRDQEF